jgi:hypothetical protein
MNLQLQGTLTFSQLIKLYTHQCFSRYPHFQIEDLTKGEKYTNNSTRFQGKGKQKQTDKYTRNERGNFRRNDKGKGKGRSNEYGPRRPNNDNNNQGRFTQNSTQFNNKGKGREKGKGKFGYTKSKGKGKGRGKGKDYQGDRNTGDRNTDDKHDPKVTNNSQRVTYLEPPQHVGDDETTIVFTQHMNRIYIEPGAVQNETDGESNEDENDSQTIQVPITPLIPHEETTQAYRHGRCSHCSKPVTTVNLNTKVELTCVECEEEGSDSRAQYFDPEEQECQQHVLLNNIMMILKDMANLPPDHPVWRWVNSTEAYCEITGVLPTHCKELIEFISWYNRQVEVVYELNQKTNLKSTNKLDSPGDWGSSTSKPITWGQTKARNHEDELKLWNRPATSQTMTKKVITGLTQLKPPHAMTQELFLTAQTMVPTRTKPHTRKKNETMKSNSPAFLLQGKTVKIIIYQTMVKMNLKRRKNPQQIPLTVAMAKTTTSSPSFPSSDYSKT